MKRPKATTSVISSLSNMSLSSTGPEDHSSPLKMQIKKKKGHK